MIHKPVRWIKHKFSTVMELRDDKRSIAAGVGIGFFWGFTPLFGFKTVFAFLTAWAFKKNKIAAMAAVSLHDILLPLYPFFLSLSYPIGRWIMQEHRVLSLKRMRGILAHPTLWWDNIHFLLPLLVGSVVLAIPLSLAAYFLTLFELERMARRAVKREEERQHQAAQENESKVPENDPLA